MAQDTRDARWRQYTWERDRKSAATSASVKEQTDGRGLGPPRAGSFCLSPRRPDPASSPALCVSGERQAEALSLVLEFLPGGPRLRHPGCVRDSCMPSAETVTQKLSQGGAEVQVSGAAGRACVHSIGVIQWSDQACENGVVPPRLESAWVVQLPEVRSAVQAARPPDHRGLGALELVASSLPGQLLQTAGVGRGGLKRQWGGKRWEQTSPPLWGAGVLLSPEPPGPASMT